MLRGGPRFVHGAPAGERDVVAFIPEVSLAGEAVAPSAVLELHESGIRRHEIRDANQRFITRVLSLALLIAAAGELVRLIGKLGGRSG